MAPSICTNISEWGGRCAAPPCTPSRRAGNARGPTANVAPSCPCRTCPRTARRQSRARFHGVLSSVEHLLDGLPLVRGDLRVDLLLQFLALWHAGFRAFSGRPVQPRVENPSRPIDTCLLGLGFVRKHGRLSSVLSGHIRTNTCGIAMR